jgi:hypothetical protein
MKKGTTVKKTSGLRSVLLGILPLGLLYTTATLAQVAQPFNTITNSADVPTNAVVMEEITAPTPPFTPTLPNSPSPAVSFQGLGDANTSTPPDTDGAVGPNHVMTMLNTEVRIQDRTGTIISTTNFFGWWHGKISTVTDVFDPRITYDPYSQRWIATAGAEPGGTSSSILIAVSQTSDPTGSWYAFSLLADTSGAAWADFPTMGFTKDRITVSWNYYNVSGGAANGVGIFVFDKSSLYSGTLSREFFYLSASTNGLSICPAITYDTNTSTVYLLQDFNGNFNGSGYLALYTISGTFGSDSLSQVSFPSTANPWANFAPGDANFAPQAGLSVNIHAGDSRINQLTLRNGSLWAAHTVFLPASSPTRCSVQWWQVNTNGSVSQRGRLDDPSGVHFYAYASIAANRFGDALIGYSSFSTNQYASAEYSLHALNDPSGTLETDYTFKAGESPYWKTFGDTRNRWGDYSRTMVDPVNDVDFWTVQEYAGTYVGSPVNNSGRWGVWWAGVQLAVPSNDFFTNAITVSGNQGSTNGTNLRATKETGEPTVAGNSGGASVWYYWTAPSSGTVAIDTIGSTFSTSLGIYTGSSVTNLTLVGSDSGSAGGGQSRVTFTATSGTTYRIVVDGVNGSMGNVAFNWIYPQSPDFILNPQSQTKYVGETVQFSSQAIGNPAPTYQWRFNGSNVGGATSSNLSFTVSTSAAGTWDVVAANSFGSVTSAPAVLRVLVNETTLGAAVWTNNQFEMTVNRVTNDTYIIQATTNLSATNWVSLATNTAPFIFTDPNAANYPTRFYRAVYLP